MTTFNDVLAILQQAQDKRQLNNLLLGLTTKTERDAFSMRIEIVKQLLRGVPQHEIARNLGVGVATVTRGSKELQKGTFEILRQDRQ